MIAACPKCHTRYRLQRDQLRETGVRLRCTRCRAVFRVRPPASPGERSSEPARPAPVAQSRIVDAAPPASAALRSADPTPFTPPPSEREGLVLVASPDVEVCKEVADALGSWGFEAAVAHDGVEAILSVQRLLPRAVVLDAALPKMFGFQVCELMKRNDSLRSIHVVLVGAVHREGRYRRSPAELYGADAYLEPPELVERLRDLLERFGRGASPPPTTRPAQLPDFPAPEVSEAREPSPETPDDARARFGAPGSFAEVGAPPAEPPISQPPSLEPAPDEAPAESDPALAEARARAERLARIIVSDIVLYNEEKFQAALRQGAVLEIMDAELAEGRALFADRVDPRVREERDFLGDELVRVARARGKP
jgi:predicted Zn finger-like uncharacterized protein